MTAKYGAHQMALIRKRLRVEMWMYERLQELYGAVSIESQAMNTKIRTIYKCNIRVPIDLYNFFLFQDDIEIDLDEVLDNKIVVDVVDE